MHCGAELDEKRAGLSAIEGANHLVKAHVRKQHDAVARRQSDYEVACWRLGRAKVHQARERNDVLNFGEAHLLRGSARMRETRSRERLRFKTHTGGETASAGQQSRLGRADQLHENIECARVHRGRDAVQCRNFESAVGHDVMHLFAQRQKVRDCVSARNGHGDRREVRLGGSALEDKCRVPVVLQHSAAVTNGFGPRRLIVVRIVHRDSRIAVGLSRNRA